MPESYKTVMLIPDMHIPDHHPKALSNMLQFIKDYQPDEIVQTGDLMDMKGPAQWSKGAAAEYEDDFQANADATVKVLGMIREVHDGPLGVKMGNHDIRAEKYLAKYAPALRSLRAIKFDALLGFDSMGIDLLAGKTTKIGPGWVAAHGDMGSLSRYSGGTAIGLARTYGVSVACGHTHKQGIINETKGLTPQTLTGFELGHVMRVETAEYMKLPPNWQMGFGLVSFWGKSSQPTPVMMDKAGSFMVDGVVYP